MIIVAFVSPKGGAGKTTAALLLALGLVERGLKVALIDSDPNKPLMHWAGLPGRPEDISVHPAPTLPDVRDAFREAQRREPDWVILDTEGSLRGAMAFTALRPDLVVTPLAGSQLEALQAVKAWEMAQAFGRVPHRCVLTRIPAAIRPRNLKEIVGQLKAKQIRFLTVPLFEKEAFRTLFLLGGGFDEIEQSGISGVAAARENAAAYVDAVLETVHAGRGGLLTAP